MGSARSRRVPCKSRRSAGGRSLRSASSVRAEGRAAPTGSSRTGSASSRFARRYPRRLRPRSPAPRECPARPGWAVGGRCRAARAPARARAAPRGYSNARWTARTLGQTRARACPLRRRPASRAATVRARALRSSMSPDRARSSSAAVATPGSLATALPARQCQRSAGFASCASCSACWGNQTPAAGSVRPQSGSNVSNAGSVIC
jgi:hypothetical protein